jgi:signal transduction histidine kinase
VVDTGTGIAKEHLASIFAPFFTTKAVGEGTGLGLAITRRIIEEHEGRVTVDSAPGAGTRVRFVVPRHARESTGGVEA